jgi:tetratricopeptide (TPR) repeat protein
MQANYWPAQLVMANYRLSTGNTEEAIEYYERINSLVPDSGLVSNNLGGAYYLQGRFEDAINTWQETLKESANTSVISNLGSSYFFLRRFDKAAEMYTQATELAPGDHEVFGFLADAQYFLDPESTSATRNYNRAIELAQGALEINPANDLVRAMLAHYLSHIGESVEARDHLDYLTTVALDDMYVYYYAATAYTQLGDIKLALDSLQRAIDLGYFNHLLRSDAGFDTLRSNKRFQQITR